MHIKERNVLHPTPIRILANRPHVRHPDPRAVVRLEHHTISDIQIVVHSFVICRFECPGPLGVSQVGQVDDVRDGDAVGDDAFDFVELVVQQHELVPVALRPPALVRVRGAGVFEAAEHFGGGFVGRVPDSDAFLGWRLALFVISEFYQDRQNLRVFIVGHADVAAVVAAVGAVVGDCWYRLATVVFKDTSLTSLFDLDEMGWNDGDGGENGTTHHTAHRACSHRNWRIQACRDWSGRRG
jgi:hypothetical protein